jgi:hypothetical protein
MNIGGTNAEARLTELSKAIERLERVIDAIRTEMDVSHKISNEEEDEPDHDLKMAIAWFGVKLRENDLVTRLVNTAGGFSDKDVGRLSLLNQTKFHKIYSDSIGSGWSLMKFKSLMLNAFIPDDQAEKYITLFERLWVEWMKSKEGQWAELPSEADEDWDSKEYSTRRFVLGVVKCYIYSIETETDIMDNMKKLQFRFNYLNDDFLASGFGFESAFLKYLRLCGGDKCFYEVKGAFELWIKNYKPLADRIDSYDEGEDIEEVFGSEALNWTDIMHSATRILLREVNDAFIRVRPGNNVSGVIGSEEIETIRSSTQQEFQTVWDINKINNESEESSNDLLKILNEAGIIQAGFKSCFKDLWDKWISALLPHSIDDVVAAEDSQLKYYKTQMDVLIATFLKRLSQILMDSSGNEVKLDHINKSRMELIRSSTQRDFNIIYGFSIARVHCNVNDLNVAFYRVSMSNLGPDSIALKPGFESLWDSWITHINKNGY